jgi:hypothetical protein
LEKVPISPIRLYPIALILFENEGVLLYIQ